MRANALLTLAIETAATLGWGGLLLRRLVPTEALSFERRFSTAGLIGLAGLATAGGLLHLLVPLNENVSGTLGVAGVILFAVRWRTWLCAGTWPVWLAALVFQLLVVLTAPPVLKLYDDGLYHLQAQHWIVQAPLPWGLAQLHARFGYNSSWFVLAALFHFPFDGGQSWLTLEPLLLTFWFIAWLESAKGAWAGKQPAERWILFFGGVLLARYLGSASVFSLDTDLPGALLVTLISALTWESLAGKTGDSLLPVAAVLASFALATKLSNVGALLLVVLAAGSRRVKSLWAGALVIAVWLARGILVSGCPAFPSRLGCLSMLPWTVPAAQVSAELSSISSWARHPRYRGGFFSLDWLPRWLADFGHDPAVRAFALLAFVGLVLVTSLKPTLSTGSRRALRTLVSATAFSLGLWLVMAPDPRFAYGFLLVGAAVPLAVAFEAGKIAPRWRRRSSWGVLILACAIVLAARHEPPRPRSLLTDLPRPPAPPTRPGRWLGEWMIRYPTKGDQCWDESFPCVPYLLPSDLRARKSPLGSMLFYREHDDR